MQEKKEKKVAVGMRDFESRSKTRHCEDFSVAKLAIERSFGWKTSSSF